MLRAAVARSFIRPLPKLAPRLIIARMAHDSISEEIIDDHEELKEYYDKYIAAETPVDQEKWANQYRWELARHTVAEEIVLYPAFEKYLGEEGKKVSDDERQEHQVQKELQAKLETMNVAAPEYKPIFMELQRDLAGHVVGEEANLEKLEKKLSREDSKALAKTLQSTKAFVPTRAHPSFPNEPPYETVVAFLAAPIDKLRDLFERYPDKSEK